jgi:archaemetzincin
MTLVKLAALNFTEYNLMTPLRTDISKILDSDIRINELNIEMDTYYNRERGQYDASKIIKDFEHVNEDYKTIIFTSLDIYIPIFTHVFGLAKLGGNTAIVSSHRLKSEFYGLPKNDPLLHQRLLKESFHELGHLCGLKHCINYNCVMNSSSNNEELDTKSYEYCESCIRAVLPA